MEPWMLILILLPPVTWWAIFSYDAERAGRKERERLRRHAQSAELLEQQLNWHRIAVKERRARHAAELDEFEKQMSAIRHAYYRRSTEPYDGRR